MPMFRKISQTVEAQRWTGTNNTEMAEWLGYAFVAIKQSPSRSQDEYLLIDNRTGRVVARAGDWIVKEDDGFYPVEQIKFNAEYEEVT